MAAKVKDLIKAATIARVSDKITGKFLGFLVKSNHTNEFYQVTCTKIAGEVLYSCTCEAKNYGHPDCCHCKAVRELVAARNQLNAERDTREIAQREAIQPAYYQACAKAESRHRLGKAAFEAVCKQVREIEAHYRHEHYVPVKEESLVERFEKQRAEAIKHGGFSLLKVA